MPLGRRRWGRMSGRRQPTARDRPRPPAGGTVPEAPARRTERPGRGRRHLPRPDPHRHLQLRRRQRAGGAGGGRVRRRASSPRSGWSREIFESADRPGQPGGAVRGRGPRRARAAHPRPPRRGAGRGRATGRTTRSPAEIADGCVWGRGAVDMKDMDAMMLAVVRAVAPGRAASRRATSCWPSSPTRRRAASSARTGWSTTTPDSSRGSPRRSARSAASRSPIGETCGST